MVMKQTASLRQVLRFTWPYMRKHLPLLLGMLMLLLIVTIATLAQPFFYKTAVDLIATGKPGDLSIVRSASVYVLLGVSCAAILITLEQLSGLILGWIESRMLPAMDADVFGHVQRLSTDFHVNTFSGANARKIKRGVDAMESIMDRIWFNFIPAMVLLAGLTVVLWFYAPLIGAVMVTGALLYVAVSIALNLWIAKYFEWVDEQDTILSANVVDTLTGNSLVKSFGSEHREDARHRGFLAEWQKRQWISWKRSTLAMLSQFLLLVVLEGTVLLLAIYLWHRGQFTPGGVVVVIFYIFQLWGRLWDLGRNFRDFLKNLVHCEEMVGLAKRPPLVVDKPGAHALDVRRGEIAFEHVRFRYESSSRWIFEDLSVHIRPGEKIALVGHSGGGKSTFVKLLFRFYDLDGGAIRIDGQDIGEATQESLRSSISLVPQDPQLFHRTIAENIAYGRTDATRDEIERAATLSHAHEFVARLPKKYDTLVGERGVKLSGGERQRVAIARAILADKPILVLDEATSSLDSLSESYIQEGLEYLMKERTTLVIAHRLSTIKKVDRILVIEEGKIVEQGSHAELLARDGGIYRHLYELQAGGFIGE